MECSLRQLIPQKFCLDCKGCCRFREPQSPWRPKVYANEEKLFCHEHFDEAFLDHEGKVATRSCSDEHVCLFLDSLTNACQVYKARPLECALYPFVLIKAKEGIFLAVHLACPFVQQAQSSAEFAAYLGELRTFFGQGSVQDFLKAHRQDMSSVHICQDEIQSLFCVLPS